MTVEEARTDFPRYAREVLKIQTKAAEVVPFVLNRVQRKLWTLIQAARDAGRPVRLYVLKARQLGVSTMTQALAYWLVTLFANRNALIISHEVDSAVALFDKSKTFYAYAPSNFRPLQRLNNRRELNFDNPDLQGKPGLKSKLVVQTADNKNLGASLTLHFVHASEFARYEQIQRDVKTAMATLLQAVPKLPDTFVILETTAQGLGYAKDVWDNQDNGYEKVFVSWVADDAYRSEQALRGEDLELEGAYGDERKTIEMVLSELRFWYPELSDEQVAAEALHRMQWRREKIAADFEGDLDLFRQEYPLYAEEAFVTSGANVFDPRKTYDLIGALQERDDQGRKTGVPRYPATYYRWDKQERDFYLADNGPLRIYEPPKAGAQYVIGADASEGVSHGDNSGVQVLRLPDLAQVAVYQEPLEPDDLAYLLDALGRTYNMARIAVETNGPGYATNLTLSKVLHYPMLYRRESFDTLTKTYQEKVGWHSNRQSKTILITDLRGSFRDDLIIFRDLETLEELMHYVEIDGKLQAASGYHDDLVIALGLALQMALQMGYSRLGRTPTPPPQKQNAALIEGSFEWWMAKARGTQQEERDYGTVRG